MFIYRPEYYKIDAFEDQTPTDGLAEIIIAKHRNGAVGDVRLKFVKHLAKFEDYFPNPIGDDYTPADVSAGLVTRPSKMNDFDDFGDGIQNPGTEDNPF